MSLLKGYEWSMPGERLGALGPDVWRELIDIARDTKVPAFIRARAATSLTLYPNDHVWAFYMAQIDSGAAPTVRRRMVDDLCAAFSELHPSRVEQVLEPLLAAQDAPLRTRAAACLATIGSDTAMQALERWRETIAEPWEKQMIFGDRDRP